MAFDKLVEQKIREAMADGRFEGVADGRPLHLEEYFSVREDLRMAYSVLKSAGCVPEEVEYLREVHRLKTALDAAADETARRPLRQALAEAELRLSLALERQRRV